jgi:hypothetical protein
MGGLPIARRQCDCELAALRKPVRVVGADALDHRFVGQWVTDGQTGWLRRYPGRPFEALHISKVPDGN